MISRSEYSSKIIKIIHYSYRIPIIQYSNSIITLITKSNKFWVYFKSITLFAKMYKNG